MIILYWAVNSGDKRMPHIWTENDDLIIFFVYKFGIENSPLTKQQVADEIGVTLGSVSWRVGNFKAIDGLGKATNVASLSQEVYKKYSSLTEAELKKLAFNP